jgi:alpha-aminoadipic semialdehyde synthase
LSSALPVIDPFPVAGVLESLSSMAHSHLEIGVASPFLVRTSLYICTFISLSPSVYTSAPHITVFERITCNPSWNRHLYRSEWHSSPAGPIYLRIDRVCTISPIVRHTLTLYLRTGKVSEGCLSMLSELPIVNVGVDDLPNIVRDRSSDVLKKVMYLDLVKQCQ